MINPAFEQTWEEQATGWSIMRTAALWLSLAFIFILPVENAVSIPGLGRISKAVGLCLLGIWVLTVLTGRFRKPFTVHAAMLLFVLWNGLTVYWSLNVDKTVESFLTYLQLLGMAFIIWDIYVTPAALKSGLQAYVLGAAVAAVSTIYNGMHGVEYYSQRYAGAGFQVNDIALILAMGIPLSWYLTLNENNGKRRFWLNLINYVYIPLAFLAIVMTGSRAGLIATFPGFIFIFISLSRLGFFQRILLLILVIGSLFAVKPFFPEASVGRLANTTSVITHGDLNGRLEIWREGLQLFYKHPFLGVGSGAFASSTTIGKAGHNLAVSMLAETGIIGFVLFSILMAMIIYHALRQPKWSRLLWLSVLLAWAMAAFTHNWEHRKQTWVFLSLVSASAGLYVRRASS
jgi:O-antigen ligase